VSSGRESERFLSKNTAATKEGEGGFFSYEEKKGKEGRGF